jgi:glycine oxidase
MRVLVIGGGVIGLTIVRELIKNGIEEITLVDKGALGQESSHAAAGMLAPQAESDADNAFFRLCCDARDFYPEFTEQLFDETGFDIELDKTGTLYAAFNERDEVELAERFAWQTAAGLDIERLSARQTHRLEPFISPDSISSLFFPNDWQIENRALVAALAGFAANHNVEILEGTEVVSLVSGGDKFAGVQTSTKKVLAADIVILATGAWTSDIIAERGEVSIPEIKPVRGQMASYQTAKKLISHVIYSRRGYVVPRRNGRTLAGATVEESGFENRVTKEGQDSIRKTALEIIPSFVNLKPTDSWSGLRPRSADGLPVIGQIKGAQNLFVSAGHYRNGVLLAPLSAAILVDLILKKRKSRYTTEFSPERFITVSSAA